MTVHIGIPRSRPLELAKVLESVRNIIENVKLNGDRALIELTRKFDGIDLQRIAINKSSLRECYSGLSEDVRRAIDRLYDVLIDIHRKSLPSNLIVDSRGVRMGYLWRSIERVGIYVPGGRKSYPSTLLMAGIPAKVAGVKELYVASPPVSSKCVNPAVAYTAYILDVEEVYNVGGAHAIAALAYGTESIKRVDKIVGPGNIYVQAAKFLVQDVVSIDGVEGPTELVVIADEYADPELVALDMMAQAEHGYGTFVVLITDSEEIASKVADLLAKDAEHDYYIITVKDIDEAISIANEIAPEHLALHVANAERCLDKITNVGAVSVGREPPALIDYIGPNHILPTNRWARARGALSVYDFLKPISVIIDSTKADREVLESVKMLARYEGFEIHSRSIGARFGEHIE